MKNINIEDLIDGQEFLIKAEGGFSRYKCLGQPSYTDGEWVLSYMDTCGYCHTLSAEEGGLFFRDYSSEDYEVLLDERDKALSLVNAHREDKKLVETMLYDVCQERDALLRELMVYRKEGVQWKEGKFPWRNK